MPAPLTVTLADPVDAWFARTSTLSIAPSAEKPTDTLPARIPEVTTIRRLCPTPELVWLRADVSDSHVVLSHPVSPADIAGQYEARPILAPRTVTLADPVAALLARVATLSIGPSIDSISVPLPTRIPAVTSTRPVPLSPCPALHCIDVSDTHSVPSQPVPRARTAPV